MDTRIGFYPSCGSDLQEPLAILNGQVDVVVFCDEDPQYKDQWDREKRMKRLKPAPVSGFVCKEPSAVVLDMRRIDVLFYRSLGASDARENPFDRQPYFLPLILSRMPEKGGLIISDSSPFPVEMWQRVLTGVRVTKFGCHFELVQPPPLQVKQANLQQVQVRPYAIW